MTLRPNKSRATTTLIFFYILLGLGILVCISGFNQLRETELNRSGLRSQNSDVYFLFHLAIGVLYSLINLGTVITFLFWFRRAYYNLGQLNEGYTAYTDGWAVGAWFIPLLNLIRPVQIMSELERETQEILVKEELIQPKKTLSLIVAGWWTLWIIYSIGSVITRFRGVKARLSSSLEAISQQIQSELVMMIINLLLIVLTILMIRQYSRLETLLPMVNAQKGNAAIADNDLLDS
jgi:hypothetical protein